MSAPKEPILFNDPEEMFLDLYSKAVTSGLTHRDIATLPALADIRVSRRRTSAALFSGVLSCLKYPLLLLGLLSAAWLVDWPVDRARLVRLWFRAAGVAPRDVAAEKCVIRTPDTLGDLFRPPTDCGFCRNVSEVARLEGVVPERFEELYAYSGRPAVVVDGTRNWSALETFSFEFFQGIYSEGSSALKSVESRCQFFPYKTEFRGLREVFRMTADRAHMKDGAKPWYIGWSVFRLFFLRFFFLSLSLSSPLDTLI